jgi:transposase
VGPPIATAFVTAISNGHTFENGHQFPAWLGPVRRQNSGRGKSRLLGMSKRGDAQAKRGFVLLPRRWVVERSFAWVARFRRLARDYERLAATLGAFHFLACACLMLATLFRMLAQT